MTYENRSRLSTITPPKDFRKWAEICDHIIRYHEDDSYNTSRDVSVNLPEGWTVTSARLTDSEGQDRRLDPAPAYTMRPNAMMLLEISRGD